MKSSTKYACIGEFSVETKQICPECYQNGDRDDCEICKGEAEDGFVDERIDIPWTTMKDIYYKIKELEGD